MTRSALITGSTSGIGLGIAHRLAKNGYHIVLNGFAKSEIIDMICHEIQTTYKVEVLFSNADMRYPVDIELMFHMIQNTFGSLDILVNNAGIQHVCPVESFPVEKWDDIIAVNLSAAFHTIRHALPLMKQKKWGRIINIASAHALVASPFKSAYVASKHGLLGLTKGVALEAAPYGVTCNAICPGYAKTSLVDNQIADTAAARNLTPEQVVNDVLLSAQSTKKFIEIKEIAELVAYLCQEEACSITGVGLSIDGGWVAH